MRWNLFRSRRTRKPRPAHFYTRPYRLALEELEDRRLLAMFTWALQTGGDFNTPTNWLNLDQNNSPGVPGANDDAVIMTPGINVTSTTTNTVSSLLCGAQLTIASGTFSIANGAGKNSHINTLVVNAGTALQANVNTLFISGGTSNGTLVAAAGATITFGNDQFTMNAGSSLTGAGLFFVGGGRLTFHVNENAPMNFQVDGGAVDGPGILTITNTFTFSGGALDGTSTTIVPVGTTLNISGTDFKYVTGGHILNIAGTATWTGTGELDGSPGSTINNSGTFNVQTDAVSGSGGAGAGMIFNNSGVFTKSGTTGTTSFQGNLFNNSGTVNVLSGTLSFDTNYTQSAGTTVIGAGATLASSGTVNIQAGTLNGLGTVNADVSNAGTVGTGSSTGTLTITRSFTQTATGLLNIKIGGPGQFDTLAVGGAATLAGTLSVINNFTPTAGQAFKILTFASESGGFTTENGLIISPNLSFNPVLNPADLTLVVAVPNPGVLQFSTAAYTATVTGGIATITVARNNGSQGTVSVTYATSDGSAMAGVSYTAASGTLTFASGVTSQSFSIPILSGAAGRGNQTVNLTLSTPSGGAILGTQTTAVLTLIDGAPSTGVITGTIFHDYNTNGVQDPGEPGLGGQTLFLDLDGSGILKSGDPTAITDANGNYEFTGLNAGTYTVREVLLGGVLLSHPASGSYQVTLTSGASVTGENFADVLTSVAVPLTLPPSTPFPAQGNANADYVEALYRAILDRNADPAGLANWTAQLNTGALSRLQVVQGIRNSPEHFTQEVTDFYLTLLNRQPDSSGLQNWVQQLEGGMREEQMAFYFLDSPEYLSQGDKHFVDAMYLSLLGRSFDAAGEANWLNQLSTGTLTHEQVITDFLYSQESLTRLTEGYYETFLQRQADPGGLSAWVGQLQQKLSFLTIGQQFLSSDEFYNRAAAQG